MIFPGSQIEAQFTERRLGSTDNSITSQAVRSAMLVASLIRECQQIQDPRASETKGNRQKKEGPLGWSIRERTVTQIYESHDSELFIKTED